MLNQHCAESQREFLKSPIFLEDAMKSAKKQTVIEIHSLPLDMGGVAIQYGSNLVAGGLNTMEAFVTLAGLLASGPKQVKMSMAVVSESFLPHFNVGRKAVAKATSRSKKK